MGIQQHKVKEILEPFGSLPIGELADIIVQVQISLKMGERMNKE